MEALIPGKVEGYGSTEEVPGGASGAGDTDSGRRPPETLRNWVQQAEIDAGARAGTTSDVQRLAELERENRELRRANAILKSASVFFAAELDRPQR
jgi:hypothetical protein